MERAWSVRGACAERERQRQRSLREAMLETTPAFAKRGQALVFTQALLHSAWQNCDSVPRKALLTSWIGAGVTGALPTSQRDSVIERFPRLRERLRPERRHLVPDTFDWLLESDYEPKWPETFPPGHR